MRWSIEAGKKKGRKPTADQLKLLASKPELDAGGFVLARAYALLSTERGGGMGLMPIRISKVWEWMDRNGITDLKLRHHIEDVITAIDATTLKRANRPSDKAEPPSKGERLSVPHNRRRIPGKRRG